MTSKVDVAEATRMREAGKTLEEIGDRFGVTRERIRQLTPAPPPRSCEQCGETFSPPTARSRCCSRSCQSKLRYAERLHAAARVCETCGKPVGPESHQCVDCAIDTHRAIREERYALIQKLWLEGLPAKEIAAQVGLKNGNSLGVQMAHMKGAGWDLPNRRPNWQAGGGGPPKRRPLTKRQVNQRLTYAIRMGRVKRGEVCERCGKRGHVDGHHADYSKPLKVEWLCRTCHMAEHGKQRVDLEEAA